MYLRDEPTTNLGQLRDELSRDEKTWEGVMRQITVDVESETPVLVADREVALPMESQLELAGFLKIPTAFYTRLDPDERQSLLSSRIDRADEKDVVVRYSRNEFSGIHLKKRAHLSAEDILSTLLESFPEESPVIEWSETPDEFRVDLSYGSELYSGGEIGDVTRGGVRVAHNRKAGLAPSVQPYLYRLVCTNGLEIPDHSLKIKARSRNSGEILGSLQMATEQALTGLRDSIDSFYALKDQKIEGDGTQALLRIADERGLSGLMSRRLALAFPSAEVTDMFGLVNFVTNQANNPDLESAPQRRRLQLAGGSLVAAHAERCTHCQQVVV